mmetsp:Transcript_25424/g.39120  ORF Transcript_25424/g.39120 Transcript_25424/m.39120 type:complete len:704 (-) Transcript_25424:127-2238(-)
MISVSESSDEDMSPVVTDNQEKESENHEDTNSNNNGSNDIINDKHNNSNHGSDDIVSDTHDHHHHPSTESPTESPVVSETNAPVTNAPVATTNAPVDSVPATNTPTAYPVVSVPETDEPTWKPTAPQPLLPQDDTYVAGDELNSRVIMRHDDIIRTGEEISLFEHNVLLEQQGDGNLVLSQIALSGGLLGSSSSVAAAATRLAFNVLWTSGAAFPNRFGNFFTVLQRDGHLITREGTPGEPKSVVWQSNKVIEGTDDFFLVLNNDLSGMDIVRGTPENPGLVFWQSSDGGSGMTTSPPTTSPASPFNEDTNSDSPNVTYYPGNLITNKEGFALSQGLDIQVISRKNQPVPLSNGNQSTQNFHKWPDAAHCFPHPDGIDKGGYAYVSNSEATIGKSGVGAIYFDANHNVIDYKMLLTGTTKNCGGGSTPWGTWISCEESLEGSGIWQVHPYDLVPSERTALGDLSGDGDLRAGMWESFCYDVRNPQDPKFFFTEDARNGPVRRFSPSASTVTTNPDNMWNMLHDENGIHEYLLLDPSSGTFQWTRDLNAARANTVANYQFCEGIDFRDGHLYFVSKHLARLFDLDLSAGTYVETSTRTGTFSNPDQIKHLLGDEDQPNGSILYGTEDGDVKPGIFGMDATGRWFAILEKAVADASPDPDETTGLSFSPDRKRMFFCLQDVGVCYMVRRTDGYAFDGLYLNLKHH